MGSETVTLVCNFVRELDTASFQLGHRFLDVVAVERNVMRSGRLAMRLINGMAAHVGLGEIEDEPSIPDVGIRKTELVSNEGTQALWVRRVEHRMYAFDHLILLGWLDTSASLAALLCTR